MQERNIAEPVLPAPACTKWYQSCMSKDVLQSKSGQLWSSSLPQSGCEHTDIQILFCFFPSSITFLKKRLNDILTSVLTFRAKGSAILRGNEYAARSGLWRTAVSMQVAIAQHSYRSTICKQDGSSAGRVQLGSMALPCACIFTRKIISNTLFYQTGRNSGQVLSFWRKEYNNQRLKGRRILRKCFWWNYDLIREEEQIHEDAQMFFFLELCSCVHRESRGTLNVGALLLAANRAPKWSFPCFQSCDLWSLGVIIYVMLCGYPPFYSKHHSRTIPKDMRKKIMTGSFEFPEEEWSQISEMAKDIVRKWVSWGKCCVALCLY